MRVSTKRQAICLSLLIIGIAANNAISGQYLSSAPEKYGENPARDPHRTVNISVLQAGSRHYEKGNPGNESNFAVLSSLAEKASEADPKPDLICFPEYSITGWSYPPEKVMNGLAEKVPGNGYWFKKYTALAEKTQTAILGWIVEEEGGRLYNTSFIIDSTGRYIGKYRKVHANLGEQTWWGWSQGEDFSPIELYGIRFGVSICADMWFPETVRCEELLGADVILHVSIADDMSHLIPARAFDSQLPIVASIFQGGSYAVDHEGNIMGKLKPENPEFRTFRIKPFPDLTGNKYGGLWNTKKGALNIRNISAYSILTDPSTRPPWTEIFMDGKGNPQTKEQLLKRFNGRYDADDPSEGTMQAVARWEKTEIEFRLEEKRGKSMFNPFKTPLNVLFVSPSGKEYLMPAFFTGIDSGSVLRYTWKVRFSADENGRWRYKSHCSIPEINAISGSFDVHDPSAGSPEFYRWGRLEAKGTPRDDIRYLKFREGPYWLKAGCDDPENFLGNIDQFSSNEKRKKAIDYLSSKGINSLYIITNNIDGDGKDVWPWKGKEQAEAKKNSTGEVIYDNDKLEEWREIFEYMQAKGLVVYLILEDDSGWKGYDHESYYREMIARFSYLPALIFNINEEYNENYTRKEALGLAELIKRIDPFDHPCGIHNIRNPDDEYILSPYVDFTSIQTGNDRTGEGPSPGEYSSLVKGWIGRCKSLGTRTLMVGIDEGRPEGVRNVWWSTYLSGGVWEAHVPGPYDRPMESWDSIWIQLGGTRRFMESVPFWKMQPDSVSVQKGEGFCLSLRGSVYAVYLPEGGRFTISLPKGKKYNVEWWDPAIGIDGKFQGSAIITGGLQKLTPPGKGDWACRIMVVDN